MYIRGITLNHHVRKGFQRTFTNDIYHIEERLQEYDPTLYIMWNPKTGEHLIMDGLMEMAIMKLPQMGFETLDARLVEHMKRIHIANGFSAIEEIEQQERRRERDSEKKLEDLAQDLAKEAKEAFNNAYNYGRVDGVDKYVNGVSM
jgi:hypothetical protein